jgi:hypothetical protein
MYNRGKKVLLKRAAIAADGGVDVETDPVKSALIASGYTAAATHNTMSEVTNELDGTGYQTGYAGSGRKTHGTKAVTEDDGNSLAKYTAANLSWTAINAGTAIGMVVYGHGASDAASPLLCWVDGGFPVATNGGNLNVNWASNGVFYLT